MPKKNSVDRRYIFVSKASENVSVVLTELNQSDRIK